MSGAVSHEAGELGVEDLNLIGQLTVAAGQGAHGQTGRGPGSSDRSPGRNRVAVSTSWARGKVAVGLTR